MIIVLSPSKTLDYESALPPLSPTQPELLMQSQLLVAELKTYSRDRLAELMGISDKLAALNVRRFHDFSLPFTSENARPALFAFKGDVYEGIDVEKYASQDLAFAQSHLRILSGLYGLLRPLDLIQPYRLEMGTGLKNPRGKNVYEFWGNRISEALNRAMEGHAHKRLVNLASAEYFKAVRPKKLGFPVLTIDFKERRRGRLVTVGLFAKKARGLMANHIICNRIDVPEALKKLRVDGYQFEKSQSSDDRYVFVR